jgi:hypothetical protein
MRAWMVLCGMAVSFVTLVFAGEEPKLEVVPPIAASRITAVTVYQANALVTRQVDVPAKQGLVELVVGPLPPSTLDSSLYSEGTDGLRVLTTRYRTRVVRENTLDEVRRLEEQIRKLRQQDQEIQRQIQVITENLALLAKLENFTSSSLKEMTDKGLLNAEGVTALAKYIMEGRSARATEQVQLQQRLQANQEQAQYLQREMSKIAAGSDRTIREAVIVVDNDKGAAGSVRLNYLVSAASWRPHYRLRAARDKDEVQLEYLAALRQQSGEDWTGVSLVLSTAQPMLNAAPPELAVLEVRAAPRGGEVMIDGTALQRSPDDNRRQVEQLRQEGQVLANTFNKSDAGRRFNTAAAIAQGDEILNWDIKALRGTARSAAPFLEGHSVTFHLERKMSVPWRDDEQLIEVVAIAMKPDYFYKAIPVLTPHVYRLANLTNHSKYVILPGEATMYIGTDFVGRAALPLVAVGERFTAGFGVDPQLQVSRSLVDKSRNIQGGNQVQSFDYRIAISSYKPEPVRMEVWDRLPHGESETVNVTLVKSSREVSPDPAYQRDERSKGLLRWDLTIQPGTSGEKAEMISYSFKMEYAREATITQLMSK